MDVEYKYVTNDLMNPPINHNINGSVSMKHSGNYSLPSQEGWTRQWYIYALFITLIILSILLNGVVIIVCIRASLRKHPTNMYFLNLAIGDSGIAAFMIIYLHNMNIPWTVATCKLFLFIQMFITIFSLNTLLLVAVERFVAVRLPTKFQAFTTQRCIIRQLCALWLVSAVLVLYPSINAPVKVDNGCFGRVGEYHLAVIAPSPLLMFFIYTSILLKLRQRQRRPRSPKITSTEHCKEINVNSEYSCQVSLKEVNARNVCEDVASDLSDVEVDNIDNDQEIRNIDRNNCHSHDMQDITKPVLQSNISTTNHANTQDMTSSINQIPDDIIYSPNPSIPKISKNVELNIQPTTVSLTGTGTSASEPMTGRSVQIGNTFKESIHRSPKRKKRSPIDERNRKAIRLVLAIFLMMIICHTGLLYTIIYASIFNRGQDYVYGVGDIVAVPYVIHTCITPVLQLKFNDMVRQGLPPRFHQPYSA